MKKGTNCEKYQSTKKVKMQIYGRVFKSQNIDNDQETKKA